MSWTTEEIENLPYRQLQKLACENGLKGNGKKHELISGLVKLLVIGLKTPVHAQKEPVAETPQNDDEQMEVDNEPPPNDTFMISESSLANSTHIVESGNAEAARKLEEELYLTADEPILSGNMNATQTLSSDGKENTFRVEEKIEKQAATSVPVGISRPPRSQLPRPGVNSGRFAESHKKMFAKMESIEQAQEKLQKNHQKAISNQAINRLATPKNVNHPIQRRFRTPSLPNQQKFRFGELQAEQIEMVQKPIPALLSERSPRPLRRATARQPEKDAKSLTMKSATDSKIVPRSRFDQLAQPKSKGVQPISQQRRSYTPNKSPYRYTDTTKMSNAEFQAYQLQLKQEKDRQNKMVI